MIKQLFKTCTHCGREFQINPLVYCLCLTSNKLHAKIGTMPGTIIFVNFKEKLEVGNRIAYVEPTDIHTPLVNYHKETARIDEISDMDGWILYRLSR